MNVPNSLHRLIRSRVCSLRGSLCAVYIAIFWCACCALLGTSAVHAEDIDRDPFGVERDVSCDRKKSEKTSKKKAKRSKKKAKRSKKKAKRSKKRSSRRKKARRRRSKVSRQARRRAQRRRRARARRRRALKRVPKTSTPSATTPHELRPVVASAIFRARQEVSKPPVNDLNSPQGAVVQKSKAPGKRALERSQKHLNTLDPAFRPKVERVLLRLQRMGWNPLVISGRRDAKQQARIVKAGRSGTMRSYHLCGRAADIADAQYGWRGEAKSPSFEFWVDLGRASRAEGLVWGGDWKKKDVPHIQSKKKCVW